MKLTNADKPASDTTIKKSSDINAFIPFITIGNKTFKYLIALDNMQKENMIIPDSQI